MSEREQAIRETGELFGIKGYNYSPLDERKVVEFISRLGDIQRKHKMDFEKLQVCKSLILIIYCSQPYSRVNRKHRMMNIIVNYEVWRMN